MIYNNVLWMFWLKKKRKMKFVVLSCASSLLLCQNLYLPFRVQSCLVLRHDISSTKRIIMMLSFIYRALLKTIFPVIIYWKMYYMANYILGSVGMFPSMGWYSLCRRKKPFLCFVTLNMTISGLGGGDLLPTAYTFTRGPSIGIGNCVRVGLIIGLG